MRLKQLNEGYKVLPAINKEKYQARSGLEGPFSTLSGKVVYYDPKEGSYYDPDTDMYMSYDEFQNYDKDYSGMKDERDEVTEAQIDKMKFVSKGFSNRKEAERQNDQLVGSGKASQKSYVYKHKDNKFLELSGEYNSIIAKSTKLNKKASDNLEKINLDRFNLIKLVFRRKKTVFF